MWKKVKLGDLCEVITKGTTPTSVGYKFEDSGINFIKVESIALNGDFITSKFDFISEDCHESLKRSQLKDGDILFSIAGALGRTAVVRSDILPANTNQALAILRLKKDVEISKKFLLYLLTSDSVKKQSEANKGGVAQQNLSLSQLKGYDLVIPPLAEQQRIVEKLDKAFEEIDRAIEATSSALSSSSVLLEKTISLLLKDPSYGWNIYTLNEISTNLDSKRIPITKADRNAGIYPYYGASGIVDYVNNWIFDETILLVSEDGANLLMRNYPIAFTATGKCWVNNHAHVLRFNEPEIHAWVEAYLNSIDISQFVSGMAQPKLNQKKLNEIPIPIPNKSLINDLNEKIESVYELSKDYSLFNSQKISSLNALKSAILAQELKGSES